MGTGEKKSIPEGGRTREKTQRSLKQTNKKALSADVIGSYRCSVVQLRLSA